MNLPHQKNRAKSRLKVSADQTFGPSIHSSSSANQFGIFARSSPKSEIFRSLIKKYLHHWPTAGFSLGIWICVWQLIIHQPPNTHFLGVAPIEMILFILGWSGLFFSVSFLTLNRDLGFWISSAVLGVLVSAFLKLEPLKVFAVAWLFFCGFGFLTSQVANYLARQSQLRPSSRHANK